MQYRIGMQVKLDETGRRYPKGTILTIVGIASSSRDGTLKDIRIQYKEEDPWWFTAPIALIPINTRITKTKPYNHLQERTHD